MREWLNLKSKINYRTISKKKIQSYIRTERHRQTVVTCGGTSLLKKYLAEIKLWDLILKRLKNNAIKKIMNILHLMSNNFV